MGAADGATIWPLQKKELQLQMETFETDPGKCTLSTRRIGSPLHQSFPGAFSLLFSSLVQIFDHHFAAVAIFVSWITRMSSSPRIGMIINVIFSCYMLQMFSSRLKQKKIDEKEYVRTRFHIFF